MVDFLNIYIMYHIVTIPLMIWYIVNVYTNKMKDNVYISDFLIVTGVSMTPILKEVMFLMSVYSYYVCDSSWFNKPLFKANK